VVTDFPNANITVWVYQRIAPGQFQRISLRAFDAWNRGEAALKPDATGFVHVAILTMFIESRHAVGVRRIDLARSKVNRRGIRTEQLRLEESAAWMGMVWETEKSTGPVVNAAGRFAVGQFKWKPTKEDTRELCRAVNQRAGTELLVPTGRT
jgi:hypothetical protein